MILWTVAFFVFGADGHPNPATWQVLNPATLYGTHDACMHDMASQIKNWHPAVTLPHDSGFTCVRLKLLP